MPGTGESRKSAGNGVGAACADRAPNARLAARPAATRGKRRENVDKTAADILGSLSARDILQKVIRANSRFKFQTERNTTLARIVRRSQIRELAQQIAMRADFVPCHLSVGVYGAEHVEHIVGEGPAILRKGCGAARIIGKNVWQQRLRHGDCIVRTVAARVFQFMGEGTDKAFVVRRLPYEVQLPCLPWEEDRLLWSCSPIRLNPAFFSLGYRATPESHLLATKSRVGQFKYDAAHILVREEIVASELHVVEQAICVEKEGIAAPTKESTVVSSFRNQRLPIDRHGCALDDDVAFVAHPSGSCALNTAKCRSLLPIF